MTDQPGLFPSPPRLYVQAAAPGVQLGRDARRTRYQAHTLASGRDPGTTLPLHPDAAAGRDGDGLRCRSCVHLYAKHAGNGRFLKCALAPAHNPRARSDGPDMRAWWPACREWAPTPTEEGSTS